MVLLIFAKDSPLYLHIFTCTYTGTHAQAHMYNQHTRGMATTRHRSLLEMGRRKSLFFFKFKIFVRDFAHTPKKKCQKKLIFTNLKKKI